MGGKSVPQSGAVTNMSVLPHGRFLRAVLQLRGEGGRGARQNRSDQSRQAAARHVRMLLLPVHRGRRPIREPSVRASASRSCEQVKTGPRPRNAARIVVKRDVRAPGDAGNAHRVLRCSMPRGVQPLAAIWARAGVSPSPASKDYRRHLLRWRASRRASRSAPSSRASLPRNCWGARCLLADEGRLRRAQGARGRAYGR